MTGIGLFAGKRVFGSTPRTGRTVYLTIWEPRRGDDGLPCYFPAMKATTPADSERAVLFEDADGSVRIRLGDTLWITLDERYTLGWLSLTEDPVKASPILIEDSTDGQRWQLRTSSGELCPVSYVVDPDNPLLTTKGSPSASRDFTTQIVAPSVQEILTTKKARCADLRHIDLSRVDLSDVDFTRADLRDTNLTGSRLDRATLGYARFAGATLTDVSCDGTDLDDADFSGASLDNVTWGKLRTAQRLAFVNGSARGAVLGGTGTDFTQANFSQANFSGTDLRDADLRNLNLEKAQFAGAIISHCRLDCADLAGADLGDAVAVGTVFTGANLRDVNAQGAILAQADLAGADLYRARMGARAFLFHLTDVTADDLNGQYVSTKVQKKFKQAGIILSPEDEVVALEPGRLWRILNNGGPYELRSAAPGIDVFSAAPYLRPAVLREANCAGTKGSGACLAGADLRRTRWHGPGATLDHADLEGAALTGGLFKGTDFTQAYLAGSDLSDSVLIEAKLRGCKTSAGADHRPVTLDGALLHSADLAETTIRSGSVVGAAVATTRGAPLFTLPSSDRKYLDGGDLDAISGKFTAAGYPLGTGARLVTNRMWFLDNADDPDPQSPREYSVRPTYTQLRVLDAATQKTLFNLPADSDRYLKEATAPAALVALFKQNGYSLWKSAPIHENAYWEITPAENVSVTGPVSYPTIRVFPDPGRLIVYGAVFVKLRDWSAEYPNKLAFRDTAAVETALDHDTLGPCGHPRSHVDDGRLSWDEFLIPARPTY